MAWSQFLRFLRCGNDSDASAVAGSYDDGQDDAAAIPIGAPSTSTAGGGGVDIWAKDPLNRHPTHCVVSSGQFRELHAATLPAHTQIAVVAAAVFVNNTNLTLSLAGGIFLTDSSIAVVFTTVAVHGAGVANVFASVTEGAAVAGTAGVGADGEEGRDHRGCED